MTFQIPGQELALESAGTTGKIKGIGEFLDNAKVNVQRFSTSTSDDVAKVGGELDEVGNVESKVGSVADDVATVANSPIKDMTSEEYEYYRVKSIVNPESDTMTLGKYRPSVDANGNLDWSVPGPDSYTVRAGDTTYFSLGSDWDKLTETYHLDKQGRQMFEAFNKPALDDAVTSGKSIRFSHDPRLKEYEGSALDWEWSYLRKKYGYKRLKLTEGYWYGIK